MQYTYNDFLAGIGTLQSLLKQSSFKPDLIVGVARGGCVPAVYLSHRTGIPCTMMDWQTRDGGRQTHRYDLTDIDISEDKKNILIIDDINDSGLTFEQILDNWCYVNKDEILKHTRTACLLERSRSSFKCDIAGCIIDTDEWVIFPWEK